jgi:S-DNA-T family DNA segregation ATPase FtsK/SpoIIIE
MSRSSESRVVGEVIGLVLLGLGTLLFLALISYEPRQVPDRFPLSTTASGDGREATNFIGPAGAILACCSYFLLGAASYLVSVVMLGFGGAKLLLASRIKLAAKVPWIVAFILSGACLLQIQPWFLQDWSHLMNTRGAETWTAGGLIGYWLGYRIFERVLFGTIGSVIVLGCIYVATLIQITGIAPIVVIRRLMAIPRELREKLDRYRLARADEQERLGIEQKKLQRETLKLERQLRKKGVPGPEAHEAASDAANDATPSDRPTPQIIDTAMAVPSAKSKFAPPEPVHFENYEMPDMELLDAMDVANRQAADPSELRAVQETLIETLGQFGISVAAGDITKGPTITRYEVYPAKGVRVDKIVSLERDLARATRAERINILAPIPGKDTVGIEIANSRKVKVTLRELLESEDWQTSKAKIPLALGKDVYGKTIIADLAQMPHCLVAGTTGSGKSVCINSIIASILYRFTPDQLRFVMIDPKVVEMQVYNTLPHLVVPVVTDPKKVLLALRWVIDEMEKRYKIFAKTGVRNITSFNARPKPKSQKELDAEKAAAEAAREANAPADQPEPGSVEEYVENVARVRVPRDDDLIIPDEMSYIVVIVDELADLMQTAPADVESAIARITQMARAAGIHMIVATQTPRADVVTGVIKANIPTRIAFQVASGLDSRIILDEKGAERLLGQGDMLYLPPGTSRMIRAQGVLVTDEEIRRLVEFASSQSEPAFDHEMHQRLETSASAGEEVSEEDEELVQKCIEIMRQEKKASTSLFQRRLRLGYTRAARVVDILEQRGFVAPGEGARPREILKDLDALLPG